MKSMLIIGFGYLFLGLGIIGLFIPIWPTTPFVLVSIACFSSSSRTKDGILRIPFFREHFENYEERRGLTKRVLMISLIWLWFMLGLSIFIIQQHYMTWILIFIGLSVSIHLMWMSKRKENRE